MKILILSDRFHPEVSAPSVRIVDHAKVWLSQGHEVTVVTGVPNAPRGEVFEGYTNRLYQEEWIDGIRTIRLWSYMVPNAGFAKRILDYQSLAASSVGFFFKYPDHDIIVASSPPLFTALAGWALSRLRRRPWVFEVRDIWPASIRATAASDNSRLLDAVESMELWLYDKAHRVVVVTDAFVEDLVSRGVPRDHIDVVINGVDTERFDADALSDNARSDLGISEDAFIAGYLGTTGLAHGLETVVEAAALCRDEPGIQFVIVGEGAKRAELEEQARTLGLDNLHFYDFVPHSKVPRTLAAFDVSIVHLRPDPLFETVIPSKIFECMSMGLPIVMAVPGEGARIVSDAGAGVCIGSGDPQALADTVRALRTDSARRDTLSDNGKAAARAHYGRRANAEKLLVSFQRAIDDYNRR